MLSLWLCLVSLLYSPSHCLVVLTHICSPNTYSVLCFSISFQLPFQVCSLQFIPLSNPQKHRFPLLFHPQCPFRLIFWAFPHTETLLHVWAQQSYPWRFYSMGVAGPPASLRGLLPAISKKGLPNGRIIEGNIGYFSPCLIPLCEKARTPGWANAPKLLPVPRKGTVFIEVPLHRLHVQLKDFWREFHDLNCQWKLQSKRP